MFCSFSLISSFGVCHQHTETMNIRTLHYSIFIFFFSCIIHLFVLPFFFAHIAFRCLHSKLSIICKWKRWPPQGKGAERKPGLSCIPQYNIQLNPPIERKYLVCIYNVHTLASHRLSTCISGVCNINMYKLLMPNALLLTLYISYKYDRMSLWSSRYTQCTIHNF